MKRNLPITFLSVAGCALLLTVGGVSAQDAFSNAVVALKPAGYWPLQETALPPSSPVTTLTNYGTLGSAGDGVLNGNVMGGKGPVSGGQTLAFDGICNANGSFSRAPYLGSAGSPPLPFTIEAWINTAYALNNGPGGISQQVILSDYSAPDASHRTGWVLYNDYNKNEQFGYTKGDFYLKSYVNGTSTQNPHSFYIKAANTVSAGQWYHVVIVLTSSNALSYVNGVAAGSQATLNSGTYVPNNGSGSAYGLTIGTRGDPAAGLTLNWAGAVAEVAYYTNVLTLSDAQADYNARNDVAAYEALVAARQPIFWYKMDSLKPQPVAKNYGTFGAVADGYYPTDPTGGNQVLPGQAGPSDSGFGADTRGFQSGASQIITTGPGIPCGGGDPLMWSFGSSFTISAWAMNTAGPMGASQQLLSHGNTSFRLNYDTAGYPHFYYFANNVLGSATVPVGDWHFWAGVYDATAHTMALYIDGVQSGPTLSITAPSTGLTASELLIGGTPFYTLQDWIGDIAHVAIFTNALSSDQISALYNAAKGCQAPEVTTQVFPTGSATCWTNSTYVFRPAFRIYCGTPTYTWTLNSGSGAVPIPGATGPTLAFQSIPGLTPGNSYTLTVTANNPPYGSASSLVDLTIEPPPAVASTIYSDAFSRSGALDSSLPDLADLYSTLWSADGSFTCNGSLVVNNSPYAFAAWLPFVPQPGHIYVASCDLNPLNGDNNFLALGFATGQANGLDYIGRTTYVDARGNRAASPGGVVVAPGTGGGLAYLPPFDAAGPSTYQVVLDTTTSDTKPGWTMEVWEDGIRQYGPEMFAANPSFTSVFLGNYMTGGGQFDNFKLTDSGVLTGAPVIIQNPPAQLIALRSFTSSIPAAAAGATGYQWQFNGQNLADNGRVLGAHTNRLTLLNVQPADAGAYQLIASNGSGSVTSAPCVLVLGTPPLSFTGANESLWTTNIPLASMSYSVPALVSNVLTLTDGTQDEAGTIFFNAPQYIGAFYAQFVYQVVNPVAGANADGVAFCLQNDPRGPTAVGTTLNNSLGIKSLVAPSQELVLNLWSQNALVGYAWTANGSVTWPTTKTPGSVHIDNGDPIAMSLAYDGSALTLRMMDNGPLATNSFSTTLAQGDLTAALGSKTAYVGFGASDYNFGSTQTISNFTFVSLPTLPTLSISESGSGGVKITWPGCFAGFLLQQRADVTAGNWTSVTNAVSLNANGNCEVTVESASTANFYRLAAGLQP